MKLAIVEDDPVIRDIVAAMLRKDFEQLFVFSHPQELIADEVFNATDLFILSDFMFSDCSGLEISNLLNITEGHKRILFMSAETRLIPDTVKATCGVIEKPFTRETLLNKIKLLDQE